MKLISALPLLLLVGSSFAAAGAPLKVSVRQLLAHPHDYDGRRVDVTGYYIAGMEDSIYIDPAIWDPQLHPRKPKDLLDAEKLKKHVVRVIGTFRARGVAVGVSTAPHGPTITNVSHFRPLR